MCEDPALSIFRMYYTKRIREANSNVISPIWNHMRLDVLLEILVGLKSLVLLVVFRFCIQADIYPFSNHQLSCRKSSAHHTS